MSNALADYNVYLVLLSWFVAVGGSLTGLFAAAFIRDPRSGHVRPGWLLLAALLMGGCAIWAMHFLGMIAYQPGIPMAYDIPMTLASLAVPVAFVLFGLYVAFRWPARRGARTLAGAITGLAVAGMHYTGMAAIRIAAEMRYDPALVATSVVIAVAAAVAALHIAVAVRGWPRYASSLLMGLAVCGMHYTGMAALELVPANIEVDHFDGAFTERVTGVWVVAIVIGACTIGTLLAGGQYVSEADSATERRSAT